MGPDTRAGVLTPIFNPAPGNVSTEDIHGYLTNGAATKIYANFMTGFCMTNDGSGHCHSNVMTGYNSDDPRTAAAQVKDLYNRHIDGALISWEGPGSDTPGLLIQTEENNNYCNGGAGPCSVGIVNMIDGPSIGYSTTSTGVPGTSGAACSTSLSAAAYETCALAHLKNDFCWMNGKYFGNPAYLKSSSGQPIVLIFPNEPVLPSSGAAPSWTDVWKQIKVWNSDLKTNCNQSGYNADNGVPLFISENTGAFTRTSADGTLVYDGAYYWIEPAQNAIVSDQTTYNISPLSQAGTLDNFYYVAKSHLTMQVWGNAFKGFNSHFAEWGTNRIMDQQCGMTWIQSLTAGNTNYTSAGLSYLQIATWNDYNEGTPIETGIDNCYTVSALLSGSTLNWSLDSSNPMANLATVSHIEIYDSTDFGVTVTPLSMNEAAAASGTYDLSMLPSGNHTLYVRMVGKNSIFNQISPAVAYSN